MEEKRKKERSALLSIQVVDAPRKGDRAFARKGYMFVLIGIF